MYKISNKFLRLIMNKLNHLLIIYIQTKTNKTK